MCKIQRRVNKPPRGPTRNRAKKEKRSHPTPSQRIHSLIADEMMTYDNEFLEGLVKSGTMILISEIGDKTFFIAAIMAMRHSRLTVRPVPPIPAEFTRLPLGLSADRPRFRSPVPIDSTGLHWRHRSARRDDRTIRGDGMGRAQPGESHSTFTPQRTFIHQSNDAIRKTSSSRTHTHASSHPPVNP